MSCVIFENLCVYYIVSVMCYCTLYVKVQDIENNPDQRSECTYECNYIMKHVEITRNLLHDNLSC